LTDPEGLAFGAAVALPDGSTIVAAARGNTAPLAVALIKVDPDGAVDPAFEQDGFAAATSVSYPYIRALAVAPDGKIVGVGQASVDGGGQAWLVARFNADGSLDSSFGTDGAVVEPMPGFAGADAVAVQADKEIVVGGSRYGATGYVQHWALARFDATGSLDASFGSGGVEVLPYTDYAGVVALALQGDGKIIAAGQDSPSSGPPMGVVARFESDGRVDNGYGTDGATAIAAFGPITIAFDLGGHLVLGGRLNNGFGLARLDANGSLDDTFGSGGLTTPIDAGTPSRVTGVAVQSDGKIVASGAVIGPFGDTMYEVARYTSAGQLDTTFSGDGQAPDDVNPGHPSIADAVSIQPDGRIVVTGGTDDLQNHQMILLRRYFATDPPQTDIDSGPQGPVNSTEATFEFSSPDTSATFTCSRDGAAYEACTSPITYSDLADGSHSFRVRATDVAHNVGPAASRAWVVDTIPPVATIDSRPAETVYSDEVRFTFSANEPGVAFACALDTQPLIPCESPTVFTGLSDGSHAFQVKATDPAGNTGSPDTDVFIIDTAHAPRPDALIAAGDGDAVGEDVFNLTGRGQHARARIQRGTAEAFRIEVENDGLLRDSLAVHGRATMRGCSLRYLHRGVDVTSAVTDGSFRTANLRPEGRTTLVLRVAVRPRAELGFRRPVFLTLTSQRYHPAKDVVVAEVAVIR
jgi:uncharacterized delta-60 repeat protein